MAKKKPSKFVEEKPQRSRLNEAGQEIPDSRPLHSSIGSRRSPTLAEQIKAAVRSERLAQEAHSAGFESFEEADDFEIGDDYDPESPYENEFEPETPNPRNAPPKAEPAQASPDPKVATSEPALAPSGPATK